eukprot:1520353-Amphidinium_carterae.2
MFSETKHAFGESSGESSKKPEKAQIHYKTSTGKAEKAHGVVNVFQTQPSIWRKLRRKLEKAHVKVQEKVQEKARENLKKLRRRLEYTSGESSGESSRKLEKTQEKAQIHYKTSTGKAEKAHG